MDIISHSIEDLPSELLEEILLRIDSRILLPLSGVCSQWSDIIYSIQFWKRKLDYLGIHLPKEVLQNPNLSWKFFYSIVLNNQGIPYQKNLIVNGSGELENEKAKLNDGNRNEEDFDESWFKSWNTLSSGGQGWRLLKSLPPRSMPQEVEHNSYFATSNFSCTKEQFLSLTENGLDSEILDNFQPDIEIEEFYSKSENHGAIYDIQVCLLDGCGNVLGKAFSFRKNMEAEDEDSWRKVTHTFKDYGVGVRFVKYYHGGMAEDMEEGWFGVRMTGSSVKVKFPEVKKTEARFECKCKTKHKMNLNLS
eukprot:GFUD01084215.1.p1 GENE.GFUD01084215.1~~GFUD01084215.1.p1  ORF type:complete len:306 (+),score=69.84 GFUD01084215.1:99-1016(+)